jgi:DNA repair exonuclease SbcCD ATPase subunit
VKLLKLDVSNFRATKSRTIDFAGQSASIHGKNGAGKSTIADAIAWNLFGKSDDGRSSFDWKPRDKAGEPIHNLDTTVTATYEMEDGETLCLSKTTKENWVKKRGEAEQEFSGHTTTYEVDGIPKTQTEYDRFIAGICEPDRFRALTNVRYLNEQIKWDALRKILLGLFGDVSDDVVIASDPKLAPLKKILGKHTVEDHKLALDRDRKATNKALAEIRPRIDEQNRTLEAATDEIANPGRLEALRTSLAAAQERKAQVSAGGEIATLLTRQQELVGKAMERENELRKAFYAGAEEAQKIVRQAEFVLNGEIAKAESMKITIGATQNAIIHFDEDLAKLRADYAKFNAITFDPPAQETICPACQQPLPEERLAEARRIAESEFNQKKAAKLEGIQTEGKALRARRDALAVEITRKEGELAEIEKSIEGYRAQVDEAKKASEQPDGAGFDPCDDPVYAEYLVEQDTTEARIAALRESGGDALAKVTEEIEAITADIAQAEAAAARVEASQVAKDRIVELSAEEKRLAAEVERMAKELYLCEMFIRAKCSRLESHINAQFGLTKWRLFEVLINGAIAECCEATIDGRGYTSALSNSERIRVGLDCIETLGRVWKFHPPVVVDNAESIHDLPSTTAQQIRLIVSPADAKLRIVADEKKPQEALLA